MKKESRREGRKNERNVCLQEHNFRGLAEVSAENVGMTGLNAECLEGV